MIRAQVGVYVEASVKVTSPDLVELIHRFQPGEVYRVTSVSLRGLPAAADRLKLKLRAGQPYSREGLRADVEQLEALLRKLRTPHSVDVDTVIDDQAKTIDVAYVLPR